MTSDTPPSGGLSYADAGVDIAAGNDLVRRIAPFAKATQRPGTVAGLGGFGAVFDIKAAGFIDPLLVSTTDGVGTKLRLATEIGRHDTVGIDLVAMCVNDLLAQGAEPLFFLDYYATGKLDPPSAAQVVKGIAEGCSAAGCALVGGETAEMPGHYAPGDYDLAGFAVGAVERDRLLPRDDMTAGDIVLGFGASGLHSNGFSLVRKILEQTGAGLAAPAPFDETAPLGEALLTPTRIYVKPLLPLIKTGRIKALAHITGGGLTENLPRVLPDSLAARIDLAHISLPPVFRWLQAEGQIPEPELLRTFNCGIGMIAIATPDAANAVTTALTEAGIAVDRLGTLVDRPDAENPGVIYAGVIYEGQLL